MTDRGDVVLIYMENEPSFFARVEEITPDVKPAWYNLTMTVLQVPLMELTWILRREYIDGVEFTMGGKPIRLEKVVRPVTVELASANLEPSETESGKEEPAGETGKPEESASGKKRTKPPKVVSLTDRLKKK